MLTLLGIAFTGAAKLAGVTKTAADGVATGGKSWIDLSRVTDVEPLCLIDQSIAKEKITRAVIQTAMKTALSYYLRGAQLACNIDNVEIVKRLNKISPNRSIKTSMATAISASLSSSYHESLFEEELPPYALKELEVNNFTAEKKASMEASLDVLSKNMDLSTGQAVEVTFVEGGNKFPVQVNFRLSPYVENSDVIVAGFAVGSKRYTMSERYHQWRAKVLTNNEFWLLTDIISERTKVLINSKTTFYRDSMERAARQKVTKGTEISDIIIISARTAKLIERKIGGVLSDYATRQVAMDRTNCMLLMIVDTINEELVIYRNTVEQTITLDFTHLKDYSEKTDDLMELMKTTMFRR